MSPLVWSGHREPVIEKAVLSLATCVALTSISSLTYRPNTDLPEAADKALLDFTEPYQVYQNLKILHIRLRHVDNLPHKVILLEHK